jgi:hypothetical protein
MSHQSIHRDYGKIVLEYFVGKMGRHYHLLRENASLGEPSRYCQAFFRILRTSYTISGLIGLNSVLRRIRPFLPQFDMDRDYRNG